MILVELIYFSSVTEDFSMDQIEQILSEASQKNFEKFITGVLMFNKNKFVQVLEGTRTAVSNRFNSIVTDPRHKDIKIVGLHEITERYLPFWSMGYIGETDFNKEIILQFSGSTDLQLDNMPYESAKKLLLNLATKKLEFE